MDLENSSNFEIIAGLMRGHKPSFQAGYSAEAAVLALANLRGMDENERSELAEEIAFAEGFALGMNESRAMINPVSV